MLNAVHDKRGRTDENFSLKDAVFGRADRQKGRPTMLRQKFA
jgi:hypothetical protein